MEIQPPKVLSEFIAPEKQTGDSEFLLLTLPMQLTALKPVSTKER